MKSSYPSIWDCFYRVSAKAFIRNEEWKFLLCKTDTWYWDVPGWGIDHGEEIHEALKREIMEEMWIPVTKISESPCCAYLTESTETKLPICVLNYSVVLPHYNFIPSDECIEIWFFDSQEARNIPLYTPNANVMEDIEKSEA